MGFNSTVRRSVTSIFPARRPRACSASTPAATWLAPMLILRERLTALWRNGRPSSNRPAGTLVAHARCRLVPYIHRPAISLPRWISFQIVQLEFAKRVKGDGPAGPLVLAFITFPEYLAT